VSTVPTHGPASTDEKDDWPTAPSSHGKSSAPSDFSSTTAVHGKQNEINVINYNAIGPAGEVSKQVKSGTEYGYSASESTTDPAATITTKKGGWAKVVSFARHNTLEFERADRFDRVAARPSQTHPRISRIGSLETGDMSRRSTNRRIAMITIVMCRKSFHFKERTSPRSNSGANQLAIPNPLETLELLVVLNPSGMLKLFGFQSLFWRVLNPFIFLTFQ
jgi:hypothetical protein